MYQVGCLGYGKCDGEASFGQLDVHSALLISSGTILENNRIAEVWVWVLYWRVMFAMLVYYCAFLNIIA